MTKLRIRRLKLPSSDLWAAGGRSTLKIDRDAEIKVALEHQGHAMLIVVEPVMPSGEEREFRVSQGDPLLEEGESWAATWSYGQHIWHLIELPRKVQAEMPLAPEPDPPDSPAHGMIGMPKRKARG